MRRMLAAAWIALAAAPMAEAQIYRFRIYDSNAGLPSNSVYSIFQDGKRYIWFATDGGASRYDGHAYTNFSVAQGLVDASARGFVEDRDGRLWILTKGGLSRWDGSHFTNLTVAQGLAHNEVRCGLSARDGTLWFGTTAGLSGWDGSRFKNFGPAQGLPAGPVWSLLEDRNRVLWVGLRGGGLARFDGARFTAYGRKEGLSDDTVFGLAEDPAGGLWLATDGGLVHFDGTRFRHYTTADGLGSNRVSSILVDRHGRVWCGTFGGGVSRLENGRFTVFGRRNGLPDEYVTSLLRDAEDEIWIGGLWAGAFRFLSERFTNYTSALGLGEGLVTGIAETPDGALWLSSVVNGLSRIDRAGKMSRYGAKEGLADERVWTLFADSQGRVWSGGLTSVSYWDGTRFRTFELAAMGVKDRVNAILEDRKGRLWFGSGAAVSTGIVVWDGRAFTRFDTRQGLAHNQVNTMALDHAGNVWICTEDGLSRFDGERFTSWRTADGLPSKRALAALEDARGALWVGTADGLARFDGRAFKVYRTQDGLPSNFVHALVRDGNNLWIGTSRGIAAFDGTRFTSYTVRDGLISNQVSNGSALRRSDGSLWFGTPEGAVRYQAVTESRSPLPPKVYVAAVRARDVALELAPALSLPHDRNNLSFEFLGLSFADEESVRYSYLLEGLDREWSEPGTERSVRFANLEPGPYRFLVKAASASGLWSEPASVALEIRAPVWRSWWFRLLALVGAAGLARAAYGWRIRALERDHRRRLESLRQLLESIRVINSGLDLPTVLQNICAESAHLVRGQPGGIGLVRENRVLFERVWSGREWQIVDVSYALGEGVKGHVAATGRAMIVNDLADPQVVNRAALEGYGACGLLDVPIIDRAGQVVGVLDVRRPVGRAPFREEDRQILESLAHQAAVAIENAGLYGVLAEKKVQIAESLWAIEELYKNEQQMTRMLEELNRMKTNFMIVTSHEMRTPLTLLKGYHEALLDGYLGALTASQTQCLEQGHRTVDRMIASFNDILEMLQIDEHRAIPNRAPLGLRALCENVLSELGPFVERRAQHVVLEAPDGLPAVLADAEKIRLVVLNLVENAIKFTPDGGEVRVRLREDGDAVELTVVDTGIGIEDWELERVFDKFYTGADSLHHSSGTYQFRARGSGLGLAIAKGHVDAHGGRIWAESAGPGRGASFHVRLPAAAPQERSADAAASGVI